MFRRDFRGMNVHCYEPLTFPGCRSTVLRAACTCALAMASPVAGLRRFPVGRNQEQDLKSLYKVLVKDAADGFYNQPENFVHTDPTLRSLEDQQDDEVQNDIEDEAFQLQDKEEVAEFVVENSAAS